MMTTGGNVDVSERDALIAWSALAEPADAVAGVVVDHLGASAALDWLNKAMSHPQAAVHEIAPAIDERYRKHLLRAIDRWGRRWDIAHGPHERRARAVGARVIVRHDEGWPTAFAGLGPLMPFALYVCGEANLDALWARSGAVVGSRAATAYGSHVAGDIAEAIARAGGTVISGGAYGIDIVAHRTALAIESPSVAVMAGGIDRFYPPAHAPELAELTQKGAVVSEVPPGFAPHRSRFLSRNRLIAAATATVVVEAAERSGALSTARHALDLLRPVGAVPGPVTAASSAGCHDLIREFGAVLIGRAKDAVELMVSTPEWAQAALPVDVNAASSSDAPASHGGGPLDFANQSERAVFDAASSRACDLTTLSRRAGLDYSSVRVAAGALSARGLLESYQGGWRRVPKRPQKRT